MSDDVLRIANCSGFYGDRLTAAREMVARTNTPHAPWAVVPADDKRLARLAVLRTLCNRVETTLR